MINSHVGIPRFMIDEFSIQNKVYTYNLNNYKGYSINSKKLGVESGYYDENVEKNLANGIEHKFSEFFHNYNESMNTHNFLQAKMSLIECQDIVAEFCSYMFLRSKVALQLINRNELSRKVLGTMSHSKLLEFQSRLKMEVLKIVGDDYTCLPAVNLTETHFIDNSIGFGINGKLIIIPFSIHNAVLVISKKQCGKNDFYYIVDKGQVNIINTMMIATEKEFGNGFVFGLSEYDVMKYS